MTELSPGIIAGLGISIVFIGLISLVFIVWLMGIIVKCFAKAEASEPKKEIPAQASAPAPVVQNAPIENRSALIAAISACLAEELGTDVSGISIQSFRRI